MSFPPATLRAAALLIGLETVVEIAYVAARGELRPAMRIALVVMLAGKLLLVRWALRKSAGSVLGLMLYEATAVIVALTASRLALAARLSLGVAAAASIALLAASAHAFPSPTLPKT